MEVGLIDRNLVEALAVDVVGHADLDLLQAREHVKLGEHEVGDPVDSRRVPGDRRVVPPATAGAAGGRAELEAVGAQELARLVEQLGRERARADARRVRLHDPDHPVEAGGRDARAGGRTATGGVRRGDERVRAVVDIQHGRLAALEEHGLAGVESLVQDQSGVGDHRSQPVRVAQQVVDDFVHRDRAPVVDLDQQMVLLVEGTLHLLPQDVLVEDVLDSDADPVDLVGIRRSDPASGRADLPAAEEALRHLVDRAVVLGDDVRVGTDEQLRDVKSAGQQRLEFMEEHLDVDDDTVRDDRRDARGQDAGGQQVQCVLLVADHHGVAGVVAAVELDDIVDAAAEKVGRLALAFIAPLGADQNDCGHR